MCQWAHTVVKRIRGGTSGILCTVRSQNTFRHSHINIHITPMSFWSQYVGVSHSSMHNNGPTVQHETILVFLTNKGDCLGMRICILYAHNAATANVRCECTCWEKKRVDSQKTIDHEFWILGLLVFSVIIEFNVTQCPKSVWSANKTQVEWNPSLVYEIILMIMKMLSSELIDLKVPWRTCKKRNQSLVQVLVPRLLHQHPQLDFLDL